MGFPEEVNAHTALADTAADGLGQFARQQRLLERQFRPFLTAADLQLFPERIGIHADTHGGNLQGNVQQGIVKQDVSVQAPVIIVRGAAVMGLAAAEGAAYLHEEYGAVFLCGDVFAFFRGFVRIFILQLLGGNEGDGVRQFGLDMGIVGADKAFSLAEGQVDAVDDVPQELLIPLGRRHDALPVPLVHKDGMDIIGFLIPADGVHIRVKAFSHGETVGLQGLPLPLGQGVDNFHGRAGFQHIEGDGAFHTVQVIIQTAFRRDHDGRGNTGKIQGLGQFLFEKVLDELNGDLCIAQIQNRVIVLGDNEVHGEPLLPKYL